MKTKHTSPYYILFGAYVLMILVILFGSACKMRKPEEPAQPQLTGRIDTSGRIVIDSCTHVWARTPINDLYSAVCVKCYKRTGRKMY